MNISRFSRLVLVVVGLALTAGCASHPAKAPTAPATHVGNLPAKNSAPATANEPALPPDNDVGLPPEPASTTPGVPDPLEGFNRAMFTFNDKAYFYVLRPVGRAYAAVLPKPVRIGIGNFFTNLRFPLRFTSNLLEGRLEGAGKETGKFIVNSTVGLGGFIRVSDDIPSLKTPPEDLGQTFAHWGIHSGFYLVLPLLGPTTARDATGQIGAYFLDPIIYLKNWKWRWGLRAEEIVNGTSLRLGDYEALKKAALDPYSAVRDAYLQHRAAEIKK